MKSKNRNPRVRQLAIASVVLILLVSGMLIYGLNFTNRGLQPTSTLQSTWFSEPTISFMNTAIAQFTQDPTLALSSTPFYAEIVNYRVLWELTTTPPRQRCPLEGCATSDVTDRFLQQATAEQLATDIVLWLTISPTASPLPTSTPTHTPYPDSSPTPTATRFCSPVLANWYLSEDITAFTALLKEYGIDANLYMSSSGVEGIDAACQIPFQPTFSQIRVGVEVTTLDDATILPLTLTILEAMEGYVLEAENISPRQLEINVAFYTADDRVRSLWTNFAALQQALSQNLPSNEFIKALGEFYEGFAD